jgi:hypothetical protein
MTGIGFAARSDDVLHLGDDRVTIDDLVRYCFRHLYHSD